MWYIKKTTPPMEFIKYCQTPGVTYGELSGKPKRALRRRLLEDQGYICCYCGREIFDDEHTKIEHVKCQKYHTDLELDFGNMLASCDGGEEDRRIHNCTGKNKRTRIACHEEHCDAKKKEEDICISPLDEHISDVLSYFDDGDVKGRPEGGKDLVQKLGLNVKYLQTLRKNAIESYSDISIDDPQAEIEKLHTLVDGKYIPFCFVIEQCLKAQLDVACEQDSIAG